MMENVLQTKNDEGYIYQKNTKKMLINLINGEKILEPKGHVKSKQLQ